MKQIMEQMQIEDARYYEFIQRLENEVAMKVAEIVNSKYEWDKEKYPLHVIASVSMAHSWFSIQIRLGNVLYQSFNANEIDDLNRQIDFTLMTKNTIIKEQKDIVEIKEKEVKYAKLVSEQS